LGDREIDLGSPSVPAGRAGRAATRSRAIRLSDSIGFRPSECLLDRQGTMQVTSAITGWPARLTKIFLIWQQFKLFTADCVRH
jgi:hypothetical protein